MSERRFSKNGNLTAFCSEGLLIHDAEGDTQTDDGTEPDDGTTSTTTTEAADDTVTTTSERLDPDDPNYPTVPPSPTVTYPETDG